MEKSKTPSYRPQYERIAELIVAYIAEHQLQPGERLPTEQEFGEQLGVSRTIVREAIKLVTPSGLIRTRRGSGIFVGEEVRSPQLFSAFMGAPTPPERIRELFDYRCVQEMQVARLAAQHISVAELRVIEQCLLTNRDAAYREDRETFLRSDDEFHRSIALASHNIFFVETVTSILQLQRWAVKIVTGGAPGPEFLAIEQHTAIFEAIREGNPDRAAEAARAHVESVFAAYQKEAQRRLIGDSR